MASHHCSLLSLRPIKLGRCYLICIAALLAAVGCNKPGDLPPAPKPKKVTPADPNVLGAGRAWDALTQEATDLFHPCYL